MSLYSFRCDTCGTFEKWVAVTEVDLPVRCPHCNDVANRLSSPPRFNVIAGLFRLKFEGKEPQVVRRSARLQPSQYYVHQAKRPWLMSH